MSDAPTTAGHVVIAGGSGFIGRSLGAYLVAAGHRVTLLSRAAISQIGACEHRLWDARELGPWVTCLDGAAVVVNLVGRTVDCIKTPDHCDEILRSRVEATRLLGAAVRAVATPPPVWVQMSTAHIYGDPPEAVCDESAPTGYGLAPTVGRAWEEALVHAVLPSQRAVVLRTSFVIGRRNAGGAGALGKLGLLARLGLGGAVGHGRQGMSWIHETDMNRIFQRAISDGSMRGIYNATAPQPVSNLQFMRHLRRSAGGLGRLGVGLPAAAWMVRLGAPLLLRTDPELALYGRYVVSRRLREEGFEFQFPTLAPALADLYGLRVKVAAK